MLRAACCGPARVADVHVPGPATTCPLPCRDCADTPNCGVPDADFIVFVTARPTEICGPTTTAHAVTCIIDSDRIRSPIYGLANRPLAGHVNFCPSAGRGAMTAAEPRSLEAVVDTAVHELMHALFMSAGLYRLYPGSDIRCGGFRLLESTMPMRAAWQCAGRGACGAHGLRLC